MVGKLLIDGTAGYTLACCCIRGVPRCLYISMMPSVVSDACYVSLPEVSPGHEYVRNSCVVVRLSGRVCRSQKFRDACRGRK